MYVIVCVTRQSSKTFNIIMGLFLHLRKVIW